MHTSCFIRREGKYVRLSFACIRFVEAHKNYPRIHLEDGSSFVALVTLKQLERYLPPELFCRIHRSFVVSLQHVTAFDAHQVYVGERALPLARHYQRAFHQKLLIVEGAATQTSQPVAFSLELTSLKGGLN